MLPGSYEYEHPGQGAKWFQGVPYHEALAQRSAA